MTPSAVTPSSSSREEARESALGLSNAAAAATPAWSTPRAQPPRAPAPIDLEPLSPSSARDVLRLVWFDADAVPRMRRVPRWKPVLKALEREALDRDLDDPAAEADPLAVEDRREVFEIIARADAADARGVSAALDGAIRKDGKYAPPLVLVAGDIETPFEEVARLEATVAAATPLATPADVELSAALEASQKLLGAGAPPSARAVAAALTLRIREAFVKEKKALPSDHLDRQVDRALVQDRKYQKRDVLGETHLRLLLHDAAALEAPPPNQKGSHSAGPLVVYAPEAIAKKLPMYQRFAARIIAEVHLQEDESETQPSALKLLALARRARVYRQE